MLCSNLDGTVLFFDHSCHEGGIDHHTRTYHHQVAFHFLAVVQDNLSSRIAIEVRPETIKNFNTTEDR